MPKELAKQLNELIDRSGFTQKKLAKESGVTTVTIWKLRNGYDKFVWEKLAKVCKAMKAEAIVNIIYNGKDDQ